MMASTLKCRIHGVVPITHMHVYASSNQPYKLVFKQSKYKSICFLRSKSSERLNCYDKARKLVDEKATLWGVRTITQLSLFPGMWGYHRSSPTSHRGWKNKLWVSRKNWYDENRVWVQLSMYWALPKYMEAGFKPVCLSWIALCI